VDADRFADVSRERGDRSHPRRDADELLQLRSTFYLPVRGWSVSRQLRERIERESLVMSIAKPLSRRANGVDAFLTDLDVKDELFARQVPTTVRPSQEQRTRANLR